MDPTPNTRDMYSLDFYMYKFKAQLCSLKQAHDWAQCPYAHNKERCRRRDPLTHNYVSWPCPDAVKGYACARGDGCPCAHTIYEYWLHPTRFRTQMCKNGAVCNRPLCFFAHSTAELRVSEVPPPQTCPPLDGAPSAQQQDTGMDQQMVAATGGSWELMQLHQQQQAAAAALNMQGPAMLQWMQQQQQQGMQQQGMQQQLLQGIPQGQQCDPELPFAGQGLQGWLHGDAAAAGASQQHLMAMPRGPQLPSSNHHQMGPRLTPGLSGLAPGGGSFAWGSNSSMGVQQQPPSEQQLQQLQSISPAAAQAFQQPSSMAGYPQWLSAAAAAAAAAAGGGSGPLPSQQAGGWGPSATSYSSNQAGYTVESPAWHVGQGPGSSSGSFSQQTSLLSQQSGSFSRQVPAMGGQGSFSQDGMPAMRSLGSSFSGQTVVGLRSQSSGHSSAIAMYALQQQHQEVQQRLSDGGGAAWWGVPPLPGAAAPEANMEDWQALVRAGSSSGGLQGPTGAAVATGHTRGQTLGVGAFDQGMGGCSSASASLELLKLTSPSAADGHSTNLAGLPAGLLQASVVDSGMMGQDRRP